MKTAVFDKAEEGGGWWRRRQPSLAAIRVSLGCCALLTVAALSLFDGGGGGQGTVLRPKSADPDPDRFDGEVSASRGVWSGPCRCWVPINATMPTNESVEYSDTTCSKVAYARGRGQQVAGYSYYGDASSDLHKTKKYFDGVERNLDALLRHYGPDWTMRLYHDLEEGHPMNKELCRLHCTRPTFDLCHAGRLPGTPSRNATIVFPMLWRFFPTMDPQVLRFVSRDLDSLVMPREWAAVEEWISSGRAFHMMRDNPEHGASFLGSAWGVYLADKGVRRGWRRAWKKAAGKGGGGLLVAARGTTGADQKFLHRYVWRWAREDCLQHDSFFCVRFPGGSPKGSMAKHMDPNSGAKCKSVGFPTKREEGANNFVASVYSEKMLVTQKCPEECRRRKEWEYC